MAFQSFSSYLARAVDYAQKTTWTIEGLGKKVIAPENNIVHMEDWFEKTEVECRGPYAANGAPVLEIGFGPPSADFGSIWPELSFS